ncbi:MAG: AMP-binding protein, partial [Proteobacteria bacterium]|nr:AMP-binding protein [Pseudomonadota bacterium]
QGIGKGSTVGICLPNTPFCIIAYYGAMKAGATVANFDPTAPADALAQQIKDSNTDVMVAINLEGSEKQPLYPNVEKAMGLSSLKKIIFCDLADVLPAGKAFGFRALNKLCALTAHLPLKNIFNKKAQSLRNSHGVKPVAKIKKDDRHISFKDLLNSRGSPAPADVKSEDVALLQYTGGTTGVPKGAALTHANLTSNIQQARLWFTGGKEAEKQQKVLAILPFFHVFSMTALMNLSLNMGSEIIIMAEPDTRKMLDNITKEKVSLFAGVPVLYKRMIDFKDIQEYDLSSLEICISGGAPLPETTMAGFKKLTGIDIIEGYGLSETSPLVIANPVNGTKKPGSIGLLVPKTEIKFADIDFPDKSVSLHMEGEICLRGPQVMKGYFGKPEETANVFDQDGFFHTGDIGVMDDDGYVFITDRKKDMIIVNGMKAFPKKIEETIRKFEGVSEVIVIGVPDEKSGEAVKAFIQPKSGQAIDPDKLINFLKEHLKIYELPYAKNIEFRNELPLTKIGKPDKKVLKEEEKARRSSPVKKTGPQP